MRVAGVVAGAPLRVLVSRKEIGAGYRIIAPLRTEGGRRVMVDLGFIPTDDGPARVAGREVPVRWRVEIPARGLTIETRPLNAQAWNATTPPYWEGPVTFEGSHSGEGYLEMTGY